MTKQLPCSDKTHRTVKRKAAEQAMSMKDFVDKNLGLIAIAVIFAVSFGSAYAENPFDFFAFAEPDLFEGSVLASFNFDGVKQIVFSDKTQIVRDGEATARVEHQGRHRVLIIEIPMLLPLERDEPVPDAELLIWDPLHKTYDKHIVNLNEGISFSQPTIEDQIEEIEQEPVTEEPTEDIVPVHTPLPRELEECLYGEGPYAAFQEKSAFDIESLDLSSAELAAIRDNFMHHREAMKIKMAIEACDVMVLYHDSRALIGAYEENIYAADVSGIDQHNRTGNPTLEMEPRSMNVQSGNATYEAERAMETIANKPWRPIEEGFVYEERYQWTGFKLPNNYARYIEAMSASDPDIAKEIVTAQAQVCDTYYKDTIYEVYAFEKRFDEIPSWMQYCVIGVDVNESTVCFKGREQVPCE